MSVVYRQKILRLCEVSCFWQQRSCCLTYIFHIIKDKYMYPEMLWSGGVFHVHTPMSGMDLTMSLAGC